MEKYILSVHAQNNPGVISRLSGLLRRKLFNIDSMTAGKTHIDGVSSLTIVVVGGVSEARKAASVIERLVEVLSVKVLEREACVRREVVVAKFRIKNSDDALLLHEAEGDILTKEIFREEEIFCLELIDTSQKLDTFLSTIKSSNIEVVDWARSGVVAIER